MIFRECPWCDKEFESSKYPASAALSSIRREEKRHMKKKHKEKIERYNRIVEIWHDEVFSGAAASVKFLVINRRFPEIPKDVVNRYDVEEVKNMREEELKELEKK